MIGIEYAITHQIQYLFIEAYLIASIAIVITSYLYQTKYYLKFLAYFIVFTSVLYFKIIDNSCTDYILKQTVAFYIGITNIILIVSSVFNKKSKIISYIVAFALLLPTIFIWQYFFISGGFVTADTILAILQTNFQEAQDYIYDFMGIKQCIGLIGLLLVSFMVINYGTKLKLKDISKKMLLLLLISMCLNGFLVYNFKGNVVANVMQDMEKYIDEYKEFKRLSAERKFEDIKFDKTKINKGIYIVVIGESQTKTHMSAYGYGKQTTPWLESMEQDKNFIKFTNVYGCHTQTAQVLAYALTSKNQYNDIPISNALSVIDIAKALDIQTAWLSNQNRFCLYDNIVSVISDSAQQQRWLNKSFEGVNKYNYTNTIFYDKALVDVLNKITLYDNMLIIIHLMGNHTIYEDRYPKEFSVFDEEQDDKIAQYDNSVLYNDYVVENIFRTVKNMPKFKALIYFADHGEDVDEGIGHDATQFDLNVVKVPMYIYFSDDYIKNNSAIYNNLRKNKDCCFTNDLVFNLLFGIWNIKVSGVYEKNNDITSNNYDSNINRFRVLYGRETVIDRKNFLKINNVVPTNRSNKRNINIPKGKVWLHATNSRKKLQNNIDNYDGFEIDINFSDSGNYFNVDRYNTYGNENLANMLKDIDGLEKKYLWFDFKNLSETNKSVTVTLLNKIVEENNLKKENIIVESKNAMSLNLFSKAGYYTSLDLNLYSYNDINNLPRLMKENIKKAEQSLVDFVSTDSTHFDVVRYCFPNMSHLFWVDGDIKTKRKQDKFIFGHDKNAYIILN
ncbi:MAG: sulfatase-like hydrolase/transferase [Elusimicrobia bacterium]|nr:sulfatase-like hydrolase/transferase [Elusimicrobiota bacterium]